MPYIPTQQLATVDDLVLTGPPAASIGMLSVAIKNAHLTKASGQVLSAYAIRMGHVPGSSFVLATWGDFTKGLVVDLATWTLLGVARGFNPDTPDGKALKAARDAAVLLLDEISDITNKFPRFDPDATDSTPAYEELGSLAHSEGGPFDEADHYARPPGFSRGLGFPWEG